MKTIITVIVHNEAEFEISAGKGHYWAADLTEAEISNPMVLEQLIKSGIKAVDIANQKAVNDDL